MSTRKKKDEVKRNLLKSLEAWGESVGLSDKDAKAFAEEALHELDRLAKEEK